MNYYDVLKRTKLIRDIWGGEPELAIVSPKDDLGNGVCRPTVRRPLSDRECMAYLGCLIDFFVARGEQVMAVTNKDEKRIYNFSVKKEPVAHENCDETNDD